MITRSGPARFQPDFALFVRATLLVLATLPLLHDGAAWAETVKGRVNLPRALQTGRRYTGYWRVENGAVPVKTAGRNSDPVIVLEGLKGTAPEAKTYGIGIKGFAPEKRTLVVGVGSVLEITNNDKVPHDLSIPDDTNLMPLQRQAPGSMRLVKFSAPGSFSIKCNAYPSAALDVLVVDHAYFGTLDAEGRFDITNVPTGKPTLKVWVLGRFVHSEAIDTSAARNLTIDVDASQAARGD